MEIKQNSHETTVICNCHCSRKYNYWGVIIRGEYNSPRWELSGRIVQGAIARGQLS